jgi:hypothetical protein
MKNLTAVALSLITAVACKADIITLQWKGSSQLQKKYVAIPAGKVCKMLTTTPYVNYGYVDSAGNEISVFDPSAPPILGISNTITIAGPVKIFFKKETVIGSFVTLEIMDQTTPKSGVAFTDN